jgi:hypothetical protein
MGPSPGCADSGTVCRFAIGHIVFSKKRKYICLFTPLEMSVLMGETRAHLVDDSRDISLFMGVQRLNYRAPC